MIHRINLWRPTVDGWEVQCNLDNIFVGLLGFNRDGDIFYYGDNKNFGYKITYSNENKYLLIKKYSNGEEASNSLFAETIQYAKYFLDYVLTENGVIFGISSYTSNYILGYGACLGTNIETGEKVSCYSNAYGNYFILYNELNDYCDQNGISAYTRTEKFVSLAPLVFRNTPVVMDKFYIPAYAFADNDTRHPFCFKMNGKNYATTTQYYSPAYPRIIVETID